MIIKKGLGAECWCGEGPVGGLHGSTSANRVLKVDHPVTFNMNPGNRES